MDAVAAGSEATNGRVIGRQAPFHVGLHVGHQGGGLNTNQDAARAHLRHRHVFEAQVATQAVQPPCFHRHSDSPFLVAMRSDSKLTCARSLVELADRLGQLLEPIDDTVYRFQRIARHRAREAVLGL
jgi:hypothetical protein